MFVIYHDISKTVDVLVHLLNMLSIPHKDRPFQPTSGLTRIVMLRPPPPLFSVFFYTQILITFYVHGVSGLGFGHPKPEKYDFFS
jgi:hypothetical protein